MKKHYYNILLLSVIGTEEKPFIYESTEKLMTGSIVLVPLKNRKIRGLVIEEISKPDFETKTIIKVLSSDPILIKTQLDLAKKISSYYLAPIGEVIGSILPFNFSKKRHDNKVNYNNPPTPKKITKEPELTPDQKKILKEIVTAPQKTKHLIFGVTGSGKTEIYLRLIAEAIKKNRTAIVLVPEISLTPQILERFRERFGNLVGVWHSQLLETEKYDTWKKIKNNEIRVVIGARSAIFTPLNDLAYIIIDEEHESSFKQDQTPRYETGQVAEWLAELTGAKLILGSATPRIETYYKANKKKYFLHSLDKRIIQKKMPPVKIVDLVDEFRRGNRSIFSEELQEEIKKALEEKRQALLFVNRRGAATFIVCRDCGFVLTCPNCEIPLTYHPKEGEVLSCHHCSWEQAVPVVCPNCKSHAIKYFGIGTQRVETEARKLFPKARIARMDRDTTRKRGSYAEIYSDFAEKNLDILVGTQLIAKGWDLPNVSVVGVISADTMLNLPDFRSSERTFALLTQLAGRTGRGYHPGKVIIQTYAPDNYAIKAAAKHNYLEFYNKEIIQRKHYLYPPFSFLIKLTFSAKNEAKAQHHAQKMFRALQKITSQDIQILGPNPSFIPIIANQYRFQVVIKINTNMHLKENQNKVRSIIKKNFKPGWIIDISPENLL